MKTNRKVLVCFLILSAIAELSRAFNAPPCPTGRHVTGGITKSNSVDAATELGLFRSQGNRHKSTGDEQDCIAPRASHFAKRLSKKLKLIRSVLSSRFFAGKKRCLSILAAAIIVAGAYPSQVSAEARMHPTSITKVVLASVRTSMDSEIKKSMTKNSFLQYNKRAPNNYLEDVATSDHIFDTTLGAPVEPDDALEENDGATVESRGTTIVEDVSQVLAPAEDTLQAGDDLMILNDKMLKTAAKNIIIVGGAAVAGLALNRKVIGRSSGGDMDVQINDVDGYETIVPVDSEETSGHVAASFEVEGGSLLPLQDKKFQNARKQPKSPREEESLAAKYAAITSVEERAYQILVDLGMVEVR